MTKLNAMAPDFTLPRDGGGTLTLSELRPQKVVLYFYPRNGTAGCTTEALDFTAARQSFDDAGTLVVGISTDSAKSHDRFIAKHELGVILASDPEADVCTRYGVWVEKQMYGRKFMGIERSTFLISGDGRLTQIWRKVKVPGHVNEVLAAAQAL